MVGEYGRVCEGQPAFSPLFLLIVSVFPATHVTALCSIGLMVTINPHVKPDVSRLNVKGRIPVKIYKPPELGACKYDRCPDDLVSSSWFRISSETVHRTMVVCRYESLNVNQDADVQC